MRSLPYTTSADGQYQTITLTTPWGKQLASPALECAETMLGAVREYERETPPSSIQLVRFVLFGEAEYTTFLSALNRS